ncbi:MAG: UDP-N-acetylmuramate--L-alanine ligase [Candidatus Pacebacteria bacterium]|nr:UDP-N-acetylmuramate--L-alanine ligase [Candidatus Paceibacterota bacterium]
MSEKKVFLSGVGGIGVSALAQYLYFKGYKIYGSDICSNENTDFLVKNCNLIFFENQKKENIVFDFDFFIYSPAILDSNPERMEVANRGIKEYSYPEFLGKISKEKFTIAISGTNGKTTTTAMTAEVLINQKMKPTVIMGGISKKFNSNFLYGDSDFFVVESCEYKNSFLNIYPDVLIITNITPDHLDFFKTFENVKKTFVKFIENVKDNGSIICNTSDVNLKEVIDMACKKGINIINYNDFKIDKLNISGKYNKENAKTVLALSKILNFSKENAKKYLSDNFLGTKRRFEYIGKTKKGALVYDDYAHNPESINVFCKTLKEKYFDKNNVIIFQPHMYSRTFDFLDEFIEALKIPDILFIEKIYSPRDDRKQITSEEFFEKVKSERGNKKTYFCKDHKDCIKQVREFDFNNEYVIATVGASDIDKVSKELVILKKVI